MVVCCGLTRHRRPAGSWCLYLRSILETEARDRHEFLFVRSRRLAELESDGCNRRCRSVSSDGATSRSNIVTMPDDSGAVHGVLRIGDLRLETGIIVHGRVIDAEGNGLSNVHLTTTGPHGPH